MKKIYVIIFTCCFLITITNFSWARPFRPGQIPNGNKFSCANCHINPAGGGARNPFGTVVENNYLVNGDVQWQAALAALDSDGDGRTNGQELQDPNGAWRIGDPAPGDYNKVSNPGVADAIFAPTLNSPANGAHGMPRATNLSWNAVNYAENYRVEVSKAQNFSSFAFIGDPISATSLTTSNLDPLTTYYWRVRGQSSSTEGDWSEIRSYVTKLGAPALVAPANNQAGVADSVNLIWNAVNGTSEYNLQVSLVNDFTNIFESRTGMSDTLATIKGLTANTHYYWRVNAGSGIDQSDWSEVRSFSTSQPGPVLLSPANGTVGLDTALKFVWKKLSGFSTYNVEVATSADFADPIITQNSINDSLTIIEGLEYNTRYYWRVNAGLGLNQSEWSETRTFRTKIAAPILLSPSNNAKGLDTTVVLVWNAVEGAPFYNVQIAENEDFTMPTVFQDSVSGTSFTAGGLAFNTKYYWRVSAGVAPEGGNWSEVHKFTTGFAPPILLAPEDSAAGVDLQAKFNWGYENSENYSYEIQLDTTLAFAAAPVLLDTNSFNSLGLNQLTRYYWRVRAVSGELRGVWSAPRTFTTLLQPPALYAPANNAEDMALQVNLQWLANDSADYYFVQLATDTLFHQIVFNRDSITETNVTVSDLQANTKYFWRVQSSNGAVVSVWSDTWTFKTGQNVPVLLLPANGAIDQPLSLKLIWSKNDEATAYHAQVARDYQFTNIYREEPAVTDTTLQLTDLPEETTFWWRVRAVLSSGVSGWSEARSFTTLKQGSAFDSKAINISISPNPVGEVLNFEFDVKTPGTGRAFIVDALGRVCVKFNIDGESSGKSSPGVDVSSLPAGAYRLVIISGEEAKSIGFIKL